ncbi:hypothetical protein KBX31_11495 [Liquorilactobacillus satsumensis]|uniref:hypothetical protein n=1 Tax=Liquorilactobacillus satsumensis TaxID=259059 RepID=UPI0021C2F22B|nr:hypothetical protein [Liquorilactobacillus satsumensis]MCP9313879.1 hypothetical protein [Liquorilactobacillus satsumensis]
MSLSQLFFTILSFMIICAVLFFILLLQMFKMRKSLRKNMLIFKQALNQFKNEHRISDSKSINFITAANYQPAKSLQKIIGLNMIPTFILLGTFFLEVPFYISIALLIIFIGAALLLPVYYLYLKKHDTEFFLKNKLSSSNDEKNKLILQFDQKIAGLNRKITFNSLQAFELLNIVMICGTLLQIIRAQFTLSF